MVTHIIDIIYIIVKLIMQKIMINMEAMHKVILMVMVIKVVNAVLSMVVVETVAIEVTVQ